MREQRIKPKVFLSHSKKDIEFIRCLENDLRKCQIDTWIDEIDIRHGESWLDEIFENGIPTCHVIFAYISENSIGSPMVQKEIDASILQKLKENDVAFLPYVSSSEVRSRLRLDLQTLHAPEFSSENYADFFPRIVSQIWIAFLNWTVNSAIKSERLGRLEAEMKLQEFKKLHEGSIFADSENKEFEYFWSALDQDEKIEFNLVENQTQKTIETRRFKLKIGSIISQLAETSTFEFRETSINDLIHKTMKHELTKNVLDVTTKRWVINDRPLKSDLLLSFGFLNRIANPTPPNPASRISMIIYTPYKLVFSEKFDRFRFWLSYHRFGYDAIILEALPDEA